MSVNRCYSEKKPGFDVEARSLFSSLHDLLEIKNLTHVRYLCRYDAEGLAPETYEKAKGIVFSEPMADVCYDEDFPRPEGAHTILAVLFYTIFGTNKLIQCLVPVPICCMFYVSQKPHIKRSPNGIKTHFNKICF